MNGVKVYVDWEILDAAEARELAAFLIRCADVLEAPRP